MEHSGKLSVERNLIISGSAGYLVRDYFLANKIKIGRSLSLNNGLELIKNIFEYGCRDLYTTGIPTIGLVNRKHIILLNDYSRINYYKMLDKYFGKYNKALLRNIERQ